MDKTKHSNRVREYVRRGDVQNLRAYTIRNQLKPTNCYLDSKKRTALHLAVKHKRKEMLTYLLKHGFDNLIDDEKGNVPLMTAIKLALRSKKRGKWSKLKVYVDFVLPLLDACPEAMIVTNKKGVCARQLVQKLVDQLDSVKDRETMKAKNPKIYSAMFDSGWIHGSASSTDTEQCTDSDCDTYEDDEDIVESMYSNLKETSGDETESVYFQAWGQYDHNFCHSYPMEYETYSDWGNRMYHEYYARQEAKRVADFEREEAKRREAKFEREEAKRREAKFEREEAKREAKFERETKFERERIYGKNETSTNRDRREYSEKRKKPNAFSEEERLYHERRKERLKLLFKLRDYEIKCQRLFGETSPSASGCTISIDDMPDVDGKFIDMLLVEQIENLSSESLKQFLRKQQIQWHPDKFMQKCGLHLIPSDSEKIMERVKEISQAINSYGKTVFGN